MSYIELIISTSFTLILKHNFEDKQFHLHVVKVSPLSFILGTELDTVFLIQELPLGFTFTLSSCSTNNFIFKGTVNINIVSLYYHVFCVVQYAQLYCSTVC